MALVKSKTLSNGATGNYWKITKDSYDRQSGKMKVTIALFMDKAHANAHAGLGVEKIFEFAMTTNEATGNRIAFAYNKIKERANTMLTRTLSGVVINPPVPTDPDLAGCEDS